ncbi:MAG: hypothetical protein ACYCWE_01580 [Eubacteriales bacterium]
MFINFNEIIRDINLNNYGYIGSGSGREVYDLHNGYVVKIAKNIKGLAQNEVEHYISDNTDSDLLAKVTYISNDLKYLVMEKADKVKHMSGILRYFNVNKKRKLGNIREIRKIAERFDLVYADFFKPNTWGKINGRYVIVDYGYTRSVREKYYQHK